jgi:hypothetical protein
MELLISPIVGVERKAVRVHFNVVYQQHRVMLTFTDLMHRILYV